MIQSICFDFNGVIIDDERLQMSAYQEVLKGHEVDLTEEIYFSALGMDDKRFVQHAFQSAGKPLTTDTLSAVLDAKAIIHRKLIQDELPLFPGVVTFLKATARHFDLCLVSMATPDEIGYVLDRARLRNLFSVVVTTEDVSACKPSPACYQHALEELNGLRRERKLLPLVATNCLAIEDSPPGIQSARAVGMRTLGVTNTVKEEDLRAAGAEVVTRSLSDWTVDAVRLLYNK